MCSSSSWPLEIGDEVFHCQLGFADHGATRALEEAVVSFFGARDGLRSRVGRRLRHARQQSLGQSVEVGEQCLLSPRNAEYILSHLVQGRGYAFLGSSQTRLPL